jgi:ATP-dependent RNA helicase DDX49/DBP8
VLTPTRELAIQISEQFTAFGVSLNLRIALIIGGTNMTEQSLKLSKRPHVVIATPGRLRHHLEGPTPPDFRKAKYLVLDECDRLLAAGFQSELDVIISHANPQRQTLLFSATLTSSLDEVVKVAMKDTLRFDLTVKKKIPANLSQEYLFMPQRVKLAYLVSVLQKIIATHTADTAEETSYEEILNEVTSGSGNKNNRKRRRETSSIESNRLNFSVMIFVGSCKRCQEISETLNELSISCLALHSLISQPKRIDALSKFKNRVCRILIATDVASRGLDIPSVDLVINYDLPNVLSDYIHRIGRTARAGRSGRALSFITQHDIDLVHSLEDFIGQKMSLATDVEDSDVVKILNKISKASRTAQLKLMESGFQEKVDLRQKRKRKQRRKLLRKRIQLEISESSAN